MEKNRTESNKAQGNRDRTTSISKTPRLSRMAMWKNIESMPGTQPIEASGRAEIQQEIEISNIYDEKNSKGQTFEQYLIRENHEPDGRNGILNHWRAIRGKWEISEPTEDAAKELREKMLVAGRKPGAIKTYIQTMNYWAAWQGKPHISTSKKSGGAYVKCEKPINVEGFIPFDVMGKMLNDQVLCRDDYRAKRDRLAFQLGFDGMMRSKEIRTLRFKHMGRDFKTGNFNRDMHLEKTKTHDKRSVTIHEKTDKILIDWIAEWKKLMGREPKPDDYILIVANRKKVNGQMMYTGDCLTADAFKHMVARWDKYFFEKYGYHVHAHLLRHEGATYKRQTVIIQMTI